MLKCLWLPYYVIHSEICTVISSSQFFKAVISWMIDFMQVLDVKFFLNYLCKQICSPWRDAKSQVHSFVLVIAVKSPPNCSNTLKFSDLKSRENSVMKMSLWICDLLSTDLVYYCYVYALWLLLFTSDNLSLFSMCFN